nr:hypothetical protein RNT25_01855 [arsenite-oxidising bacterium NT-25]
MNQEHPPARRRVLNSFKQHFPLLGGRDDADWPRGFGRLGRKDRIGDFRNPACQRIEERHDQVDFLIGEILAQLRFTHNRDRLLQIPYLA